MQLGWHWYFLRLHVREIIAGLIMLALAAGLIAMSWIPYRTPNFGFGPGWDCSNPGRGESVCVKREDQPGKP